MKKIFSTKRIIGTSLIFVLVSILIVLLDLCIIKNNSIIFLDDYDSIITTIWSMQATISTLAIAFLSIFVNRIDDVYYGMTVKELLVINSNKAFGNYYEQIFLVIIINATSAIPVIFNSMSSVVLIAFIHLIVILNIIGVSLRISMDDNYATSLAKKYVEKLLESLTEEITKTGSKVRIKNEELLMEIVHNIIQNIANKERVIIEDDRDFMFIIKIMSECRSDNIDMVNKCNTQLSVLFNKLIRKQDYLGAYHLSRWLIYHDNLIESRQIVREFCFLYYERSLDEGIFKKFINDITSNLTQSLDKYLDLGIELLLQVSLYADTRYFLDVVRNSYNFSGEMFNYKFTREKLFQSISAYMYYIGIKEPIYIDQYGEELHKKVNDLINLTFYRNSDKLSCSTILKKEGYLYGLSKCHELLNYDSNSLRYKILMEYGQVRRIHIKEDIYEYSIFMIFSIYRSNIEIFDTLWYDFLIKLRKALTEQGELDETFSMAYEKFCTWIQWEKTLNNPSLLKGLDAYLKKKVMERVQQNRKDKATRLEKISNLKNEILSLCKKNPFYAPDEAIDNEYELLITEDINLYSKGVQYFGLEKNIFKHMLARLFYTNEPQMKKIIFNAFNQYSNDEEIKFVNNLKDELLNNTFTINTNESIDHFFRCRDFEIYIIDELLKMTENIENIDYQWDIDEYAMIYIDKTKFMPKFSLDKNFIEEIEYWEDSEIEKFVNENCTRNNTYYMSISNELEIECSKEECYEYIKESKFKLKCKYHLAIAEECFGMVVYLNK